MIKIVHIKNKIIIIKNIAISIWKWWMCDDKMCYLKIIVKINFEKNIRNNWRE